MLKSDPKHPYAIYKSLGGSENFEKDIYTILKEAPLGQDCFEIFCKIWSGYREPAVKFALTVARYSEDDIKQLLGNPLFIEEIQDWFDGIRYDGERAARTIGIIWKAAKKFYNK
jgi:hypothetical protein